MSDLQAKIEKAAGLQLELRKLLLEIVGDIPGDGGGTIDGANLTDGSVTTAKFAADAKAPKAGVADSANSVAAANVSGTLAATQIPTLAQSKITNLSTDLAAKLTASQAAAQANSTATDVAGIVADFNSLLAKLRTAKIIAT